MALHSTGSGKSRADVAEKDITCYKIVYPADRRGKFLAYVRPFRYEIGKEYTEKMFYRESDSCFIYKGFHSFSTQKAAKFYFLKFHFFGKAVMIKCVIPKGAYYFTGCGDTPNQYCSDKIKVVAWKPVWDWKWREKPENKTRKKRK